MSYAYILVLRQCQLLAAYDTRFAWPNTPFWTIFCASLSAFAHVLVVVAICLELAHGGQPTSSSVWIPAEFCAACRPVSKTRQ